MTNRETSGREREAALIRKANRAAAVGRLMLGQLNSWQEFLQVDCEELVSLPRRRLRSGRTDVRKRMVPEVKAFCDKNFHGMSLAKLAAMYEEVKALRGLEMPLPEFESRFARVRAKVLQGNPAHLTVSISLWGLQFRFPEDELAKDVAEALDMVDAAQSRLSKYERQSHKQVLAKREETQSLIRRKLFGARAALIACVNLVEAYVNGLAWEFLQCKQASGLSNNQRELLDGSAPASIRKKLLKYPEIIAGGSPWEASDSDVEGFLSIVKPFRDSLVHPSPFAAPEKFGGYDKLRLLYRLDSDTAHMAAALTASLLSRIHQHVRGEEHPFPPWLVDLLSKYGGDEKRAVRAKQRVRKRCQDDFSDIASGGAGQPGRVGSRAGFSPDWP